MTHRRSAPIEKKVWGATGGSAVGTVVAGLLLWILDDYVFTSQPVPDALSVAVVTLVPIGLTFLGGFMARHTPRSDLDAQPADRQVHRLHDDVGLSEIGIIVVAVVVAVALIIIFLALTGRF